MKSGDQLREDSRLGLQWAYGSASLAVLGSLFGPTTTLAAQEPEARRSAIAAINADGIARRIGILAADSFRGRATPSPELDLAAAYVAAEFRRAACARYRGPT